MTVSLPGKGVVAVLVVAGALCACTPVKKDASTQPIQRETYKPTGSHIVERSDGRRSPKNSSSAPVRDLEDAPAVTIIPNQAPK
ncbi:MAG TPA: hypothetical protein VJT10_21560 [Steroidobacteraceae bacterium]|nr:hypothetical protein [Steroidobacteraceae bacterium]